METKSWSFGKINTVTILSPTMDIEIGSKVSFKDEYGNRNIGVLESWHYESGATSYVVVDKGGFKHNLFKDPSWKLDPEVREISNSLEFIMEDDYKITEDDKRPE